MKNYLFLIVLCFSSALFAKSNLVGVWVDGGNTLSIQIVDDPGGAPFTAGELFSAIEGNSRTKAFKTGNLEIKCTAVPNMNNMYFGSCEINVNRVKVEYLGPKNDVLFSVSGEEATEVLTKFGNGQDSFLLIYGEGIGEFRLEANWKKNTFGFLLYHELVSID